MAQKIKDGVKKKELFDQKEEGNVRMDHLYPETPKEKGDKETKQTTYAANTTGNAPATGNTTATGNTPVYTPPTSYIEPYIEPTGLSATLNNVLASKPQDFDYDQYNRILGMMENYQNREPFSYDLNADMLYQQYKNQYMLNGQRAMQDTVGQVAALNGGYANSYAQTAGQQAYNNELSKLNNVIPELYQLAYNRYSNEGDEMLKGIELANDAYKTRYNEYQDALGNWRNDVNLANNLYQDERNYQQKQQAYELDNYQTALGMAQQNAGSSSLNATMNELVRMGIITEDTARNLSNTYSTYTPTETAVTTGLNDLKTIQQEINEQNFQTLDDLAEYLDMLEANKVINSDTAQMLYNLARENVIANDEANKKRADIEDKVSKYGYYFQTK